MLTPSPEAIHLLVVEDSAADAELIRLEMRRAGYHPNVTVVCTRDAYRNALVDRPWDAIVSDFDMPEFRATEALEILKAEKLDIPFFIVSGTITDDIAVASMKAGAKDYLIKDNLHRLAPAIERERKEAAKRREAIEVERKGRAAEIALRRSEASFDSLAHAIPQIVFTWDSEGRTEYLNERGAEYTGLSVEDLRRTGWSEIVPALNRASLDAAIEGALAAKTPLQTEIRLRDRAGVYRWHLLRVVPVNAADGGCTRWCGTLTDVEEMIRMREELRRSNNDLEKFAFVASHDLKEPLRMVNVYAQLLESRYKSLLDKTGLQFLGFLTEGATRMYALIDALLAYSQVSRSGRDLAPVDTPALFERARRELAPSLQESGAELTHDELPNIEGDSTQIVLLFQNLLSNAIKFRSRLKPKIHVSAKPVGTEIQFSVTDNGMGVAPEYHEKIFEIFQRLEDREKYAGTGIGLALCKTIVQRHHGRIWIESTLGRGATFHFTLPSASP